VRNKQSFPIDNDFIDKAIHLANTFCHLAYLNPNQYNYPYGTFLHVLAFEKQEELSPKNNSFESLKDFLNTHKDWVFGYLSYDLKNENEALTSKNKDSIEFPLMHFFTPKHLLFFNDNSVTIESIGDPSKLFEEIQKTNVSTNERYFPTYSLQHKINKAHYLSRIKEIQNHILKGDIYEMNFCQEFFIENATIDPLTVYKKLNDVSPMPFSCLVKTDKKSLICASPERYLKKDKNKIISQPIKGTAKNVRELKENNQIQIDLQSSQKELSENIMIVDLVRNDLSHFSIPGSVQVEELCKLYSFPKVHQLISTVTAEIAEVTHPVDVIKMSFPMGSMTGAPKIRAMQIIDDYEASYRGLFSGAVGYFTPELDFDFNVVIRSILYNSDKKYLSFQVGSAITYYSDPEKEYEECKVKLAAIIEVMNCEFI